MRIPWRRQGLQSGDAAPGARAEEGAEGGPRQERRRRREAARHGTAAQARRAQQQHTTRDDAAGKGPFQEIPSINPAGEPGVRADVDRN